MAWYWCVYGGMRQCGAGVCHVGTRRRGAGVCMLEMRQHGAGVCHVGNEMVWCWCVPWH